MVNINSYKKLDHREHVLARPGMYIGSVDIDATYTWVYDSENSKMIKKEIQFIPGLYKIFDEILVNAMDHVTRLSSNIDIVNTVKNIKIDIDKETGYISVYNDGEGVDVYEHEEYKIYIPELLFGNLLTSANFDDTEERIIGGQNGIGAKACNIFSKEFIIETLDSKRGLKYKQIFSNNMSKIGKPKITASKTGKSFTKITFLPDYPIFGVEGLTDDMYSLFLKRVNDVCAMTDKKISVFLNGVKMLINTFEKYVDLYIGEKDKHSRVYEKFNKRWEIVATFTDSIGFEQVSFVNGIATIKGGKHVDYIANQITNKMAELMNKKKGNTTTDVKPANIKNYLMLFVNAIIPNPTFDSQSKETLTLPQSKFDSLSKFNIDEKNFIKNLMKTELYDKVMSLSEKIEAKAIKKTDGKKSSRISGLPKLDDANFAGTNKSKDCTLILTEGDSAKTMALSGVSEVGRDHYGVFPLRGKLLNVKDAPAKKIMENEEIQNIKKIMGLESGKTYTDINSLRYGRIMIMSDQDYDGSHIRGLIMNLFHTCWRSLMEQNFIVSLLTPIVKVSKASKILSFYNMSEYEKWMKSNENGAGWKIKYYKGLGTSNATEAKEYFKNMNLVKYVFSEDSDKSLELAFNKKKADERKTWLSTYDSSSIIEEKSVTYTEFINKELIHFSVYDVKRSIPSLVDGFKPSQRKILFSCFKRNLKEEIKVSQLSGYVSEHAGYHHGEASLQGAIINMAQNFVGSNNINLLKPNGMFGSRRMGGKDASESRYIFTQLNEITLKIFRKEDSDMLNYLNDDGFKVEPEYYLPILPIILINGACGIGTGFSTNIPCYNPKDIIDNLKILINGKGNSELIKLTPWYRGFTGKIEQIDNNTYVSKGIFKKEKENKIRITELPVGSWTADYKEFLDTYTRNNPKILKDYESQYTNESVDFILYFQPGEYEKFKTIDDFEKEFKLVNKNINTNNMHLFDCNNKITKYTSVDKIIKDFYDIRYKSYVIRKSKYIEYRKQENNKLNEKIRFIRGVISGTIPIMNSPKSETLKKLNSMSFVKECDSFNYLLNMPIYSLTQEKVNELTSEGIKLQKEINDYINTSIETIWIRELEEVESLIN